MKSVVVNAKVIDFDPGSAMATLLDTTENDDVVKYNIFVPAYFGGQTNPWPKVGEPLRFRYDHGPFVRNPIQDIWRPGEEVGATPA